jgi:hypothetical protein
MSHRVLRRATIFASALAASALVALPAGATRVAEEPIYRFADGAIVGSSEVVRGPNGISFRLATTGLEPGYAYTVWVVVFNNPSACTAPTPFSLCSDPDVGNPAAMPDVLYGTGHVVGGPGTVTFAGHRRAGDGTGSITAPVGLPAFGLTDPAGAEILLVVHEHGPVLPAYLPDQIRTVGGSCTDAGIPAPAVASPFNAYAGPEFGRRGPNTCRSVQFSFHTP